MSTIIGWDAASQSRNNGFCTLTINRESADIKFEDWDADNLPKNQFNSAQLICIDSPLGWPFSLQQAFDMHPSLEPDTDQIFKRLTDQFIQHTTKTTPLEVGGSWISRTNIETVNRLGSILTNWKEEVKLGVFKDDNGKIVEVYPSATLSSLLPIVPSNKQRRLEALIKVLINDDIFVSLKNTASNEHQLDAAICAITGFLLHQKVFSFHSLKSIKQVTDCKELVPHYKLEKTRKEHMDKLKRLVFYFQNCENCAMQIAREGWIWTPHRKNQHNK